jgi:hypothetical protein
LASVKTQSEQIRGKPVVPCAQCLLQTIEGLVEPADVFRESRISETSGLRAIHYF